MRYVYGFLLAVILGMAVRCGFQKDFFGKSSQDALVSSWCVQVDWRSVTPQVVSVMARQKVSYLFEGMDPLASERLVETQVMQGTAFFWTGKSLLVTNKHVVDDPNAHYVVVWSGLEREVSHVWFHEVLDLAFLEIEESGEQYSFWSGDVVDMELGMPLYVLWNIDWECGPVLRKGILSAEDAYFSLGGKSYTGLGMVDVLVSPGSSGSPVFDACGGLQGVVLAQDTNDMAFFVPISIGFLEQWYVKLFWY